jgi:hypothetical protein
LIAVRRPLGRLGTWRAGKDRRSRDRDGVVPATGCEQKDYQCDKYDTVSWQAVLPPGCNGDAGSVSGYPGRISREMLSHGSALVVMQMVLPQFSEKATIRPCVRILAFVDRSFCAEGKIEFPIVEEAQKRAMVLLENRRSSVPIRRGTKVWLFHIAPDEAKARGLVVVDTPAQAEVAIIRAETPSEELHLGYFFGSRQHEGRLNLQAGDPAYDALLQCGKTPAVMTVYIDRPAILTDVKDKVAALYADFGVSDASLLDVLMGNGKAQGHLPFELPSSMDAVRAQRSDVPHDSIRPLYPYGYALKP